MCFVGIFVVSLFIRFVVRVDLFELLYFIMVIIRIGVELIIDILR